MRLRPDQLAQSLSKGLQAIYIVSGDETLLIQECCDAIRGHCRQQGFSREILTVDTSFDWSELTASSSAMSLFAERKLIELRIPSGKPGKEGSEALRHYTENLSPDNVLLIVSGKIDSASTRSKWYKTIETAGAAIQVWPISPKDMPRWIHNRLSSAGFTADQAAVQMLAERVEGNLLAAVQEIEKLRLFVEGNTIDINTIASAVSSSARYDVFGLVDTALDGDNSACIRMLSGLKAEGVEPPILLWALSRELRTLYHCQEQINQGNGIDRVLQNQRVWDKRKGLIKAALQRLKLNDLNKLIKHCAQIDLTIKGVTTGNSWDLLEQLVLDISGNHMPRNTLSPH